jgi:glycosyltransferase involved in cell wall biosynthesis
MKIAYIVHNDPSEVSRAFLSEIATTAGRTTSALVSRGHEVTLATSGAALDGDPGAGVQRVTASDRRALYRSMARIHPDVVHVNGIGLSLSAVGLRRRLGARTPIVVQHHGEGPGHGRSLLAQRIAGHFISAYLFTGGEPAADLWRTAGVIRAGVPVFDVVEAGTDLTPAPGEILHGDPAVLWVGRDTPTRDLGTARRAVERLGLSAHLHVVDSTAGWQPYRCAQLYTGASVFLSTSHHEAAGHEVINARACGVPLALSDIPPHRSIAPEAYFFQPGDIAGAAKAIRSAMESPREPRRWTWDDVADQLLTVYGKVMT